MIKEIRKGDNNFNEKLRQLEARYTGKKKNFESETAVNVNKHDLQLGYVTFWSDNGDIAKLIKRSKGYILSIEDDGESVSIKVDKKGFRSCFHAFKISK